MRRLRSTFLRAGVHRAFVIRTCRARRQVLESLPLGQWQQGLWSAARAARRGADGRRSDVRVGTPTGASPNRAVVKQGIDSGALSPRHVRRNASHSANRPGPAPTARAEVTSILDAELDRFGSRTRDKLLLSRTPTEVCAPRMGRPGVPGARRGEGIRRAHGDEHHAHARRSRANRSRRSRTEPRDAVWETPSP